MKLEKKFIIWYVLGALVLALAVSSSVYFYLKYKNTAKLLANPASATTEANKEVLDKLGKLIQLPVDESPTIATVTDTEKLRDQPFFTNAKNGDKLIVYSGARKAILYDPVTNRIIDVAPVNIGTQSATPASSQESESVKVAVYNGTTTVGLTGTAEKFIREKLGTGYEVILRENAASNDYEKTVVIDLSGSAKNAGSLAGIFGAEVKPLPPGEKKPVVATGSASVLIILGRDFTAR